MGCGSGTLIASMSEKPWSIVRTASFSADGRRILTQSSGNMAATLYDYDTVRLWDANTGVLIASLKGHEGAVQSALFSLDSGRIVTASADKTARLWDADGAFWCDSQRP